MPAVLVLRRHDRFSTILEQSGIAVVNLEVIATEPIEDLTPLQAALDGPVRYDGFFVTSPAAALVMIDVLKGLGREHTGMIYVLGERSKRLFEDAGINVEFCPSANTADQLIDEFSETEFAGKRLGFVCGDRSIRTIPDRLQGKAEIDELIVYRTVETVPDKEFASIVRERLGAGGFDWACFFSPSAVDAFDKLFGRGDGVRAAVIGDTTAERARQSGFDVAFISPRSNAEDFAQSFVEQVKTIG
jgi:uroporphyrinogen-III synthase